MGEIYCQHDRLRVDCTTCASGRIIETPEEAKVDADAAQAASIRRQKMDHWRKLVKMGFRRRGKKECAKCGNDQNLMKKMPNKLFLCDDCYFKDNPEVQGEGPKT